MELTLEELHMQEAFPFLDDINVPGRDFPQELERLEHVFTKIRKHQLKLNAEKCQLFRTRVNYCGHIVSENGIETDPEKIKKIEENFWVSPVITAVSSKTSLASPSL